MPSRTGVIQAITLSRCQEEKNGWGFNESCSWRLWQATYNHWLSVFWGWGQFLCWSFKKLKKKDTVGVQEEEGEGWVQESEWMIEWITEWASA